ncbi:hypothetical protein [Halobacillus sp. H74]|uniref:hypothetical protein n=1 Tax=Halobacillus sp. H74 TaxID=3457436 RepID=UPI003FCD0865
MKSNRFVLLDLICYVVFPLAVWNITRDYIGDYYAMLLSSIPGIIYAIYRFKALKKVGGFFYIGKIIKNSPGLIHEVQKEVGQEKNKMREA